MLPARIAEKHPLSKLAPKRNSGLRSVNYDGGRTGLTVNCNSRAKAHVEVEERTDSKQLKVFSKSVNRERSLGKRKLCKLAKRSNTVSRLWINSVMVSWS
jgi:hypothetical protein